MRPCPATTRPHRSRTLVAQPERRPPAAWQRRPGFRWLCRHRARHRRPRAAGRQSILPAVVLLLIVLLLITACGRDAAAGRTERRSLTDPAAAVLTSSDLAPQPVAGKGVRAGGIWQPLPPQASSDGALLGSNPYVLSTIEVYQPGEAERVLDSLRDTLRGNVTQALPFPGRDGRPEPRRVYLWDEPIDTGGDERIAVAFEAATGERGYLVAIRWGDVVGFLRHYAVGEAPEAPDFDETLRLVNLWDARLSRLLTAKL